jgi:hypothetical protein
LSNTWQAIVCGFFASCLAQQTIEVSANFGDRRWGQAAALACGLAAIPAVDFPLAMRFGNRFCPARPRPVFGVPAALEPQRKGGLARQATLRTDGAMTTGRERTLVGIGGPCVFPMRGRKIIKRQQYVAILVAAGNGRA